MKTASMLVHVLRNGASKRACLCGLLCLTVGSTLSGQISVASGTQITGISNNASGAAAIESGSWVSIYGTGLSATTRSWQASDFSGNILPTTLDNVSVQIDGKKAAISYVSPGQLNVQAPTDTATGPVQVQVTNLPPRPATGTVTLQNYSPAFFTFQAKYAAALHNTDGVLRRAGRIFRERESRRGRPSPAKRFRSTLPALVPPRPPCRPANWSPVPRRLSDLTQLHVTIGGVAATVQYAGIVAPGEYQINVIVPQLANGDQPILATIGGVSSQTGISIPILNSVGPAVTVTLTPAGGTIRCGATLSLTAKVANTTNSGGDLAGQRTSGRQPHRRDGLGRRRLHRARRFAESRGGNRDRRQPGRPHGQGQRDRESPEPSAGGRVGDSQPGESRQCDHHG